MPDQTAVIIAALAAFAGGGDAFTFSSASSACRGGATWLCAATLPAPGDVATPLKPPSAIEGSTADLFDARVQPTYGRSPLTFVEGSGSTLIAEDGREYLDFVAGIATCALGHGNSALASAVGGQMERLHHVSNLYYTPSQGKLAAWLCENSCADKAFFCNSGAEANEAAIKLARRHASNRGITVSDIACAGFFPETVGNNTSSVSGSSWDCCSKCSNPILRPNCLALASSWWNLYSNPCCIYTWVHLRRNAFFTWLSW